MTTKQSHLCVSPCWPHRPNVRRNRCQEDLNSFSYGDLEETTRTPSHYVDCG